MEVSHLERTSLHRAFCIVWSNILTSPYPSALFPFFISLPPALHNIPVVHVTILNSKELSLQTGNINIVSLLTDIKLVSSIQQ